jgi:hypothetical protein
MRISHAVTLGLRACWGALAGFWSGKVDLAGERGRQTESVSACHALLDGERLIPQVRPPRASSAPAPIRWATSTRRAPSGECVAAQQIPCAGGPPWFAGGRFVSAGSPRCSRAWDLVESPVRISTQRNIAVWVERAIQRFLAMDAWGRGRHCGGELFRAHLATFRAQVRTSRTWRRFTFSWLTGWGERLGWGRLR